MKRKKEKRMNGEVAELKDEVNMEGRNSSSEEKRRKRLNSEGRAINDEVNGREERSINA